MGRYKWLVPSWPSASVGITPNPHFLSNVCNWEVLYFLLGNRRALHGRYVFAFFHVETISPIKTNLEKCNKLVWCSVMRLGGRSIQFPIRFIYVSEKQHWRKTWYCLTLAPSIGTGNSPKSFPPLRKFPRAFHDFWLTSSSFVAALPLMKPSASWERQKMCFISCGATDVTDHWRSCFVLGVIKLGKGLNAVGRAQRGPKARFLGFVNIGDNALKVISVGIMK